MDANMKCKKAGVEQGIMPIKYFRVRWRRDAFQTQYPMWNCSWIPWKNNLSNGHQYKMQKSRDRGGNNSYKIFSSRVEEGNISYTISYVKLFITTKEMKNNSCYGYQYEMQKSGVEQGKVSIKSLQARWGRETFQTQYEELYMTIM